MPGRRHPLRASLLLVLLILALNLAATALWAAWQLLPWLLAAAAVVAYRAGQRHRIGQGRAPKQVICGRAEPPAWTPPAADHTDEVIRLRAEVEALRAERDQAREAARAAWEASTEPGSEGGVTGHRILADPRSGARPLGGAQ
jgi:hypothetical protein